MSTDCDMQQLQPCIDPIPAKNPPVKRVQTKDRNSPHPDGPRWLRRGQPPPGNKKMRRSWFHVHEKMERDKLRWLVRMRKKQEETRELEGKGWKTDQVEMPESETK